LFKNGVVEKWGLTRFSPPQLSKMSESASGEKGCLSPFFNNLLEDWI
jgi:hypothetical protein